MKPESAVPVNVHELRAPTVSVVSSSQPQVNEVTTQVVPQTDTAQSVDVQAQTANQVNARPVGDIAGEQGVEQGNQPLEDEQLENVVTNLNAFVQSVRREITFSIDEDTQDTVITVSNSDTEEVIRQIPSEQMLELAKRIGEIVGLLLEEKA